MTGTRSARLIAFYLPQFHPIPVNDAAWGEGFTEWTNVRRARPLFPGHQQPVEPADLGYYDLRDAGVREAQAALARDHGIEGFCYWHYWSRGRRLLERPFEEVLASGRPDFPFCLGWANQSWTGVWHGDPERTIARQEYGGEEDDEQHFHALLGAFRDERYIRVNGKPLFLVFVPSALPDPPGFTERWRKLARQAGLEDLHLIGFSGKPLSPGGLGFDGTIRHQPPGVMSLFDETYLKRVRSRLLGWRRFLPGRGRGSWPAVYLYEDVVKALASQRLLPHEHPIVLPNWDNTPRTGPRGQVFLNSTPDSFRTHLQQALARIADRDPERRLLFLKSWNEWAEGNYLEPDTRYGQAYLKAIREIVTRVPHRHLTETGRSD